jgi:hypothetical protein
MNIDALIEQVRAESRSSAFLTPWGIAECKRMDRREILQVFGEVAAEFWDNVRAGRIKGAGL